MKSKMFLFVSAVLVFFLSIGSATAMMKDKMMMEKMMESKGKQMGMNGGMAEKGMPERFLKMVNILDLTDAQKKEIQAIRFTHEVKVVRKKADMDVARIELREIMAADKVDMKQAEKKIRDAAGFQADLEIMALQTREQVKSKLTPEQLEKLKKHMAREDMDREGGEHAMMSGKHGDANKDKADDKDGEEKDAGKESGGSHDH